MMVRRSLRWAVVFVSVWWVFYPASALAHARLLRSNPEDGAVLAEPPRKMYLWFDEPVMATFSSAQLLDANGQTVGPVAVRADVNDPSLLILELPMTASGVYSLAWKIVSTIDSHTTQGTLVFGVNQTVANAARPQTSPTSAPFAEVALRGLLYLALSLLIGGAAVFVFVLRGAEMAEAGHRVWQMSQLGAVSAFTLGLGAFVWQWSTLEHASLLDLLLARYGTLWLAQQGLLLMALLALLAVRRRLFWGWPSTLMILLALAGVLALNSHAASVPSASTWAITSQATHLVFAATWIGGLITLVIALVPQLLSGGEARAMAWQAWRRFSRVALVCVAGILMTGLYNTARQIGSVDAWLATHYGQVLLAKLVMFLLIGLAGLLNSAALHSSVALALSRFLRWPGGKQLSSLHHLPVSLMLEVLGGLLVIGLTGWLTALPTGRGSEFVAHPVTAQAPSSLSQSVNDLVINLQVRPNKPGPNFITVGAFSTRRPAPAEVIRVQVRLQYASKDLGAERLTLEPEGENSYRLNSSALSLAGPWQIQVVVRRAGLEDAVANFAWQVDVLTPSTPPRSVLISNQPLEPFLTTAAGVVGGISVLLMGLLALISRKSESVGADS